MPCPQYKIQNTKYGSKICNIFTLVRSAECRVMSGKWESRIKMLTGWIIMAFLAFVPKITGCQMGTAQNGDKGRAFPADFFPNFRKILSFSSPAYRLLHTACCAWPPLLNQAHPLSNRGLSLSKSGHPLSKPGLSLSKSSHSLSPQAPIALYSYAIRSLSGSESLLSCKSGLRSET